MTDRRWLRGSPLSSRRSPLSSRRSPLAAGVLAGLAVAVASCTFTTSPSPTSESVATPSAPVATALTAACSPEDLKISHGLVEGGAGSRFTQLVLVSATACSVELYPALGLRDGTGGSVVGAAAQSAGRIDLSPEHAYASDIRIGNWCLGEPTYPLTLVVLTGGQEVAVTGGSFPEQGDLPPCNGDGPPVIEGGAWTVQG